MKRLCITVSDADAELLQNECSESGMTKSAYIRMLVAEHKDRVPYFYKYRDIIEKLSELNVSIKELLITEDGDDAEKLRIYENFKEIQELFKSKL